MQSDDDTPILLTVIECDGCHETIGTIRKLKLIEGMSIKYVYCSKCGDRMKQDIALMHKQMKELQKLLTLTTKELENVDKYDGT